MRLYPVPLRYLEDNADYKPWETISVRVRKSDSDPRPESYKVDAAKITRLGWIGTGEHWRERRELLNRQSSWHFSSMAALMNENQQTGRSLGLLRPGVIDAVKLQQKPEADREAFRVKREELRTAKEADLFDPTYRDLEYLPFEIALLWSCEERCKTCQKGPHRMRVLDWGLLELGRREGWDKAVAQIERISNQRIYDFQLFLGNFRLHQTSFGIIGLWYPKIAVQGQLISAGVKR